MRGVVWVIAVVGAGGLRPSGVAIDRVRSVVSRIRETQKFAATVEARRVPRVEVIEAVELGVEESADERLRACLRSRGYAIVRSEAEDLRPFVREASRLLEDDAAVIGIGGAVSLAPQRPGEFFGAYGDECTRFVDVRFDGDGGALPHAVRDSYPVDDATTSLTAIGLKALDAAGLDRAYVDDPTDARPRTDAVSSSALRLCWYNRSSEAVLFGAHTDSTFVTVAPLSPGIEFYGDDGTWHAPDVEGGDDGSPSSGPASSSSSPTPPTPPPSTRSSAPKGHGPRPPSSSAAAPPSRCTASPCSTAGRLSRSRPATSPRTISAST